MGIGKYIHTVGNGLRLRTPFLLIFCHVPLLLPLLQLLGCASGTFGMAVAHSALALIESSVFVHYGRQGGKKNSLGRIPAVA